MASVVSMCSSSKTKKVCPDNFPVVKKQSNVVVVVSFSNFSKWVKIGLRLGRVQGNSQQKAGTFVQKQAERGTWMLGSSCPHLGQTGIEGT